jgi:acyl-CoA thioester hydrolase
MDKPGPGSRFPTLDQVRELPVQLDCVIPPEWEDRNGHVNVQFYLARFELGGWKVLEAFGVDNDWLRRHAYSFFDLEHHLHYLAEIGIGDRVTTYNRVVGSSAKRFHGLENLYRQHQRLSWAPPLCGTMAP